MSGSTVAVWSSKGGLGKSVTAVNVAAVLAERGRVLLVDLDAQSSASRALGVAPADGLLDALRGEVDLAELVVAAACEGLDVVPGGSGLARAERLLAAEAGAETLLRSALEGVRYSAVVLDCGPGVSTLSVGALVAATLHLAPVPPDPLSVAGLADALALADAVRERLNAKLAPSRVLLSRVPRTRAARLTSEGLRERLGARVLAAEIPERAVVVESLARRIPVVHYAPESPPALAFRAVVEEVLP